MAPPDQTKFHIFSQMWLLAGVVGSAAAAAASIPLKQKFPH